MVYFFFFFAHLAHLAFQTENFYRKSRNLSDKKPKTKLPKYVMSRGQWWLENLQSNQYFLQTCLLGQFLFHIRSTNEFAAILNSEIPELPPLEDKQKKSTQTFLGLEAISWVRVLQSLEISCLFVIKFPLAWANLIINNFFNTLKHSGLKYCLQT